MSIIEQAAKRLEELKRAGIEIPVVKDRLPGHQSATVTQAVAAQTKPQGNGAAVANSASAVAVAHGLPEAEAVALRPMPAPAEPALNDTAFTNDVHGRRSRSVNIDLVRLAEAGYVTPDAPRSQLADEYRVIKRPLLQNAQGKSAAPVEAGNLIMVTSAMPGEGKTFSAINLALSMAMELDSTVLLVDADVARPSVLDRLGLPPQRGLLDVLTDNELDLSDVLLRTNIEKLTILPAGSAHDRATELLASENMHRLVDELASRYPDRILIFDAPPLLPSTESRVLATHMGQVVVVVEAERTPQGTVTQALAAVESCPVVMMLLNKVTRSEVGGYYGYYGY